MKTEQLTFGPSGQVPNNQTFPVIIYRNVGTDFHSADFEATFSRNGWSGIWRNGVFDYHHYHSGAHEVLGVGRGEATLQIGGPEGQILDVARGDCLILPAGTGHMKLNSSRIFKWWVLIRPGRKPIFKHPPPALTCLSGSDPCRSRRPILCTELRAA